MLVVHDGHQIQTIVGQSSLIKMSTKKAERRGIKVRKWRSKGLPVQETKFLMRALIRFLFLMILIVDTAFSNANFKAANTKQFLVEFL
jgi:hypothetical protein